MRSNLTVNRKLLELTLSSTILERYDVLETYWERMRLIYGEMTDVLSTLELFVGGVGDDYMGSGARFLAS